MTVSKKYTQSPDVVEAWQYDGIDNNVGDLMNLVSNAGQDCDIRWGLNETPYLELNGVALHLGDWLCRREGKKFFRIRREVFEEHFHEHETEPRDYSMEFRPWFGANRCRVYNYNTNEYYLTHGEVYVEADEHDDFDPKWLGPTPNKYHYGYCSRCGQPFKWRVPNHEKRLAPTVVGWYDKDNPDDLMGWVEITKEEIAADYAKYLAETKRRAVRTVRELEEAAAPLDTAAP